jgi:hypothetical protein
MCSIRVLVSIALRKCGCGKCTHAYSMEADINNAFIGTQQKTLEKIK